MKDIFKLKSKIEKLYEDEIDMLFELYDRREEIYLKINIDDINFFNKNNSVTYSIDDEYYKFYISLALDYTIDKDHVYAVLFFDDDENTYNIENTNFKPRMGLNARSEDAVDKILRNNEEYYLEINFYSLYTFMNRMAAFYIMDSINGLYHILLSTLKTNGNLNKVLDEINVLYSNKDRASKVKEILDIIGG